jgi:hypothetical protein
MYKPYENGSSVEIQGLKIHIPPLGYGSHCDTGELGMVDVIKRSGKASEQYWEPQRLPEDFEERVLEEQERQDFDPLFVDFELEAIREREWRRREYGLWFYNNGEPVYLTGLNYFFINYWPLDTGLPDFRIIDLEYFYFWQYIVEDPLSFGMIEVRKRRDGKSYRAGCMLYECISRSSNALGGIQSKNEKSASEFFQKTVVTQFKKLPSFFIPVWDTSNALAQSLPFKKPSTRGKNAKAQIRKGKELNSFIEYRDSKPKAFDGSKTKRLVRDEEGKVDHDVVEKNILLKHCCLDNKGKVIGKMLVTSTCEEIGIDKRFDILYHWSNPLAREGNGRTKSGLYAFFMPAHRAGDYDIYGFPKEEENLKEIQAERDSYRDYPDDLIAEMRKRPLTINEAFMVSANECVYNSLKLNEQLDFISWNNNLTSFGDFAWKDGKKYTEVEWVPNKKGRWEISYLLPQEFANNIIRRGNNYIPGNRAQFCAGSDPYDFNKTKDGKRSMGTVYVKWRFSSFDQTHPCNDSLIVRYANRPDMADMFYDDVIKTIWYYGAEILVERNRYGLAKYMMNEGLNGFLIYLPGEKEPGVYATGDSNQELTRITEAFINKNIHKVPFPALIKQWLSFDPSETEKFDEAMGAGYALLADRHHKVREITETREVHEYFRKHKIA